MVLFPFVPSPLAGAARVRVCGGRPGSAPAARACTTAPARARSRTGRSTGGTATAAPPLPLARAPPLAWIPARAVVACSCPGRLGSS